MKLTLLLLFYILISISVLFVVLDNVVPFNTLSNDLEAKRIVFTFLPQGWAFFTRNPKEGQVSLYSLNGNLVKNANYKHNSIRYYMGLNRKCTKLYSELMVIRKKIPDSLFYDINWNYQCWAEKRINIIKKIPVFNCSSPFKDAALGGKLLMIIQNPVPWAWSGSMKKITMPAKAIILNVK